MAQAALRYHLEIVQPGRVFDGRRSLSEFITRFYRDRLQLHDAAEHARGLARLISDGNTTILEMAHDGQLPHLGIVRLVVKTHQLAQLMPQGLALYLVGDHYSADMRPENLYIGLPLRGLDSDHVKTPLTIPVGRRQRHIPFKWLPPPPAAALDELERLSWDRIVNSLGHGKERIRKDADQSHLRARLSWCFDLLRESARRTKTFSDWLIRVQVLALKELYGGYPSGLAVLPMSEATEWLPAAYTELLSWQEPLGKIKAAVSADQLAAGETPYGPALEAEPTSFWTYCPNCNRRYRPKQDADLWAFECKSCRIRHRLTATEARLMPDIVAYEMGLFRLGIAGWVVGSRAPYHLVIERAYEAKHSTPMPPKFFLTSVPVFRGIGEPLEGHRRARLLRVLFEVEGPVLLQKLLVGWAENPEIVSPYLRG